MKFRLVYYYYELTEMTLVCWSSCFNQMDFLSVNIQYSCASPLDFEKELRSLQVNTMLVVFICFIQYFLSLSHCNCMTFFLVFQSSPDLSILLYKITAKGCSDSQQLLGNFIQGKDLKAKLICIFVII